MDDPVDVLGLPVRRDDDPVDIGQESFTVNELSNIYGISRDEIQRAVYEGELKADRSGEAIVRIHAFAVLEWMKNRGPGV